MPTFNTILMRYEPRPSKIVNIMFSPFNKNTFMVNSASGEIIIYIIGQVCINIFLNLFVSAKIFD